MRPVRTGGDLASLAIGRHDGRDHQPAPVLAAGTTNGATVVLLLSPSPTARMNITLWPFSPAHCYWLLALVLLLLRTLVILVSPYGLYLEEPYYWSWAQQLAWGYYSKPPLIAAIIAATTIWSDSVLAVKAGSLLLYPLSGWFVFLCVRRLSDALTAWRSAALFCLLPGISFSGLIISTDVPLLCCWLACLWLVLCAAQENRWHYWLWLGLALGLGLLAKYNMLLLLPGLLLGWRWLPRRQPLQRCWQGILLALFTAMLLLLPNLWWNLNHQLSSVEHTIAISGATAAAWQLRPSAEFLLAQAALIGPGCALALLLMLRTSGVLLASTASGWPLLICLPGLAVGLTIAGFGQANANWLAPIIATLAMSCGLWASHNSRRWWLLLLPNLLLAISFYLIQGSGVGDSWWQQRPESHPYKRILGWQAVGEEIAAIGHDQQLRCVISPSREILAWLGYLQRQQFSQGQLYSLAPAHGRAESHFDQTTPLTMSQATSTCLLILPERQHDLAAQFSQRHKLASLARQWHGAVYDRYQLYRVSQWQGPGR